MKIEDVQNKKLEFEFKLLEYLFLEFVKKITNASKIDYKPLSSEENSLRDTVGIIIAASGNEKRWSIKNYLKVIKFLTEKNYKKFF